MSFEELIDRPRLELDDTFDFDCRACGKCCKNKHDIILIPYDLYRLSVSLGRTPLEIVKRYAEVYEGQTSHLPVVRILPLPPDDRCPFLKKNGRCAVHDKKPVLCRAYPLARISSDGDLRYVFSGAFCKHPAKSITVRDWLGDVASEEAEAAGRLWGEALTYICPRVVLNAIPEKLRQDALQTLLGILYLDYDMKQPFVPQFSAKFEKLKVAFSHIEEAAREQ